MDKEGLNPYSIGIWSATDWLFIFWPFLRVLILILLEYGLRHTIDSVYPAAAFSS